MNEPVGAKIEGSKFYRVYCTRCGTPMRTLESKIKHNHFCESCSPPHVVVGRAGGQNGLDRDPDAYARKGP